MILPFGHNLGGFFYNKLKLLYSPVKLHKTMFENFIQELYQHNKKCFQGLPDKKTSEAFIDRLFEFLFLPDGIRGKDEQAVLKDFFTLKEHFTSVLKEVAPQNQDAEQLASEFFAAIPAHYQKLKADARLILQFDPASESLEEVLMAYPGFYATMVYRFSHFLYRRQAPILPRFFSEYAHNKTGIDIHPGARIGHPFFIDHGTGIVIGETTVIGNNVKIYQGVTLGALSVEKGLSKVKRHPTIEDNVVIYANATILGGETTIGQDSIIGGNVWLTASVPPNSVVYHKSEVTVKNNLPEGEQALNFVI